MQIVSLRRAVLRMALVCWASVCAAQANGPGLPPAQLTINPNTIVTPVSPMLYGLMTEEINHSYDGGLYAEMVDNRTFRAHWDGVGNWGLVRNGNARASFAVDKNDGPSKALPTSLKLTTEAASPGNQAGLSNSGYWGM